MTLWALTAQAASLKIFVSIPPQKYFVQKIGGDLVSVSVLVPAGSDPHTYEPKPKQMADLSKSAVYFAVGVDFEKVWLKKMAAANPKMRIVHTDNGIRKIVLTEHDHDNKGNRHSDGSWDPHVWLSPALVKIQAEHIFHTLVEIDPKNQKSYKTHYARFLGEINALDHELKALFSGRTGEQFMVIHPSWGYFANAYGLEQVPVALEGKEPKPAQIQALIRHAKERGIRTVFVQPQFSSKTAEMLSREIGGQIVYADPLAEQWSKNLLEVARKISAAAR